jgi:hypothetical protein
VDANVTPSTLARYVSNKMRDFTNEGSDISRGIITISMVCVVSATVAAAIIVVAKTSHDDNDNAGIGTTLLLFS